MKIVSLQTNHCFYAVIGIVGVVVVGLSLSNAVVVDATTTTNDFEDVIVLGGSISTLPMDENNECMNPVISDDGIIGICEPNCYCIPDREPCNECPTLDNRVIAASAQGQQDSIFFNSLEIDNIDTLFTFVTPTTTDTDTGTGTGCQPYPLVAQFLQLPVCDGLIQESSINDDNKNMGKKSKKKKGRHDDDEDVVLYQCSFDYVGKICESNKYNLVQEIIVKPSIKDKKKMKKKNMKKDNNNTFITHEGTCGVCSTSKDLAINLSPTLDQDAFTCTATAAGVFQSQDPTQIISVFPNLINCFLNIGFTFDCSFIWASNGLNTLLTNLAALAQLQGAPPSVPALPESCTACALECIVNDPTTNPVCSLPIIPGTCELTPCFSCDEDASGPIFKLYSGRTRRNSGIVTTIPIGNPFPFVGTKRECSTISNIKQPSRTCDLLD